MKILHLNTYASGGAFIAAMRIHKGLLAASIKSEFLTLNNSSQYPKIHSYLDQRTFFQRITESVKYRFYDIKLKRIRLKFDSLVSLTYSAFNITNNPLLKEADIIHLHWIPEMIDFRYFFKKINKPVIWTQHDDWINNEIHHYRNNNDGTNSYRSYYERKEKAIAEEKINLVTPSTWLLNRTKKHHPGCPVIKIAYGIEISDKRKIFDLNRKLKVLLISEDIEDERKGIWPFLHKIKEISKNVEYYVIGRTKYSPPLDNIYFLGFINSEEKLIRIIKGCDLFIIPSKIDNLPNVLLEVMNIGIPAIGFKTGGIPELIIHEKTGFIAEPGNYQELIDLIQILEKDRALLEQFGSNAKGHISSNFDINKQVRKYINLYESIL